MKIKRKILSIMLSVCMVVTMIPYGVFAAQEGATDSSNLPETEQGGELSSEDSASNEDVSIDSSSKEGSAEKEIQIQRLRKVRHRHQENPLREQNLLLVLQGRP